MEPVDKPWPAQAASEQEMGLLEEAPPTPSKLRFSPGTLKSVAETAGVQLTPKGTPTKGAILIDPPTPVKVTVRTEDADERAERAARTAVTAVGGGVEMAPPMEIVYLESPHGSPGFGPALDSEMVPEMTIGGAPDVHTILESGGIPLSYAEVTEGMVTVPESTLEPGALEPEEAKETESGAIARLRAAARPRTTKRPAAEAKTEEAGFDTDETESEPSEATRAELIQQETAERRERTYEELRGRLYKQKSLAVMRKHGFSFDADQPEDERFYTYRQAEKGAELRTGPRKGQRVFALGPRAGHKGWVKRAYTSDPNAYRRSPRYPPMRSQAGPARRRDPIRINNNILRAEEAARVRWGWARSEDVYVTT